MVRLLLLFIALILPKSIRRECFIFHRNGKSRYPLIWLKNNLLIKVQNYLNNKNHLNQKKPFRYYRVYLSRTQSLPNQTKTNLFTYKRIAISILTLIYTSTVSSEQNNFTSKFVIDIFFIYLA